MAENRGRNRRGRSGYDKANYIRLAAVVLIAATVVLAVIFFMGRGDKTETAGTSGTETTERLEIEIHGDSEEASQQETESVAPDNSQYSMDFSAYELKKDEIPQVNKIISQYFQAKVDQDAAALFKLFGKSEDDPSLEQRREELKAESVYIEDYQGITCYTKPGLTEDSYVVYVTYDVKFRRVDTLAPGLMWCYVAKADDGNYIIRENVVGDEADYVAKQNQTEDVRLLSAQTNERLRQAIESDTLLAGIYSDLRNGAVVTASEEENGGDSAVELIDKEGPGGLEPAGGADAETEETSENPGPGVLEESGAAESSAQTQGAMEAADTAAESE